MTIEEKKARLVQLVKESLLNDWKAWSKEGDHSSSYFRNKPASLDLRVGPGVAVTFILDGGVVGVEDAAAQEIIALIDANVAGDSSRELEKGIDKVIAKLER